MPADTATVAREPRWHDGCNDMTPTMFSSRRQESHAPLASDLDTLLEVEDELEQRVERARSEATRLLAEARERVEAAARAFAAQRDAHTLRINERVAAQTAEQLAARERAASVALSRYEGIRGDALRDLVDALVARFARSVVEGEPP